MTFEQYIQNPMGVKSAVLTNRKMYQNMYEQKWDAIRVRENGTIIYKLYKVKDKEDYYIHFKIPSEVVPKFYYDVIIRFYLVPGKSSNKGEPTLINYESQFYSNDPSFVYTFAHAFKENNLLIKDLEPKMSKLALKTKAEMRNPHDDIGYVKALYFAYLEMKKDRLFNKVIWNNNSVVYNKSIWNNTVTHADDKVKDRQEKGEAIKKKEKAEQKKKKKESYGAANTKSVKSANEMKKPDFSIKNIVFSIPKNLENSLGRVKTPFQKRKK